MARFLVTVDNTTQGIDLSSISNYNGSETYEAVPYYGSTTSKDYAFDSKYRSGSSVIYAHPKRRIWFKNCTNVYKADFYTDSSRTNHIGTLFLHSRVEFFGGTLSTNGISARRTIYFTLTADDGYCFDNTKTKTTYNDSINLFANPTKDNDPTCPYYIEYTKTAERKPITITWRNYSTVYWACLIFVCNGVETYSEGTSGSYTFNGPVTVYSNSHSNKTSDYDITYPSPLFLGSGWGTKNVFARKTYYSDATVYQYTVPTAGIQMHIDVDVPRLEHYVQLSAVAEIAYLGMDSDTQVYITYQNSSQGHTSLVTGERDDSFVPLNRVASGGATIAYASSYDTVHCLSEEAAG